MLLEGLSHAEQQLLEGMTTATKELVESWQAASELLLYGLPAAELQLGDGLRPACVLQPLGKSQAERVGQAGRLKAASMAMAFSLLSGRTLA